MPKINPALSYILGVLVGDGYCNGYRLGLHTTSKKMAQSFAGSLAEITGYPRNVYKYPVTSKRPRPRFRVSTTRSEILSCLLPYVEDMLKIREVALECPLDFLRGFYESEGCLSIPKRTGKPRIIFTNTKQGLVNLVLEVLQVVGFSPTVNVQRFKKWHGHYGSKPVYRIHLLREKEVHEFLRLTEPSIKGEFNG